MMLFPAAQVFPPGFFYRPDFLTKQEEQVLLSAIRGIPLHPFHFKEYEAKRRVASFGYHYHFENSMLSKGEDIPPFFDNLIQKVSAETGVSPAAFVELLVTEYPAGAVINWHRDAPPFDIIAGVSLLSDCTFRLRPHEPARRTRTSILSLEVKRRSLYVMRETARTAWQHSIAPVQQPRYSITLRTIKDNSGRRHSGN